MSESPQEPYFDAFLEVGEAEPERPPIVQHAEIIAFGGGLLAAVGSFLPWATVTSLVGMVEVNGFHGDGLVTAVIAAAMLLAVYKRAWRWVLGTAGIGLIVAGIDTIGPESRMSGISHAPNAQWDVGYGIYICVAGFLIGGFVAIAVRRHSAEASIL